MKSTGAILLLLSTVFIVVFRSKTERPGKNYMTPADVLQQLDAYVYARVPDRFTWSAGEYSSKRSPEELILSTSKGSAPVFVI